VKYYHKEAMSVFDKSLSDPEITFHASLLVSEPSEFTRIPSDKRRLGISCNCCKQFDGADFALGIFKKRK